jgi:hypothetical protein
MENHRMMRNRRHTLLWMKDLLEHMNQCHEQLQWAADGQTEAYLAETLLVDLTECQKLCEQLKPPARKAPSLATSA